MCVVDEVGQYVARDIPKMLDLQAIVQQLGVKGRGKVWVMVTSQEMNRAASRKLQYMTRCPFSLSRLVKVSDTGQVIYQSEKQACHATFRFSSHSISWPSSHNIFLPRART